MKIFIHITFMHLAEGKYICRLYLECTASHLKASYMAPKMNLYQYACSLGIKPTTFADTLV